MSACPRPLAHLTLASAGPQGGTVVLGPGQPHLVMFFATWLSEVSDLKSEFVSGNAYVAAARRGGLPQLVAVDETVVESSAQTVRSYLCNLGTSLNYPVALDTTGGWLTATECRTSPGSLWSPPPARSSGHMTAGSRHRPSNQPPSAPPAQGIVPACTPDQVLRLNPTPL
jgi:hypothetical protein